MLRREGKCAEKWMGIYVVMGHVDVFTTQNVTQDKGEKTLSVKIALVYALSGL